MPNLERLDANRVEEALKYLATTDTQHAKLSGRVKQLEELLKSVKAKEYLIAEGTDGIRKAQAESSWSYIESVKEWAEAWTQFKTIDNLRSREFLVIDIWRSLEASRRKGNI